MSVTIADLASRPVITVEVETPVLEALKLMSARRISCVVVLLAGEPVGILTERDLVFAANWVIGQPGLKIREVMSKPVLAACGSTTLGEAYQLFCENRIRHLVVLGDRMAMDGIFTQTDLVRALERKIFTGVEDITPLMSGHVWRVAPQTSARHALALMASHAISGVVVVEDEQPLGVFTERDAVRLVASGVDLTGVPVGTVMTSPAVTISATGTPTRAIELMRGHAVRRLLVVDDQGGLAGMLTQTDLCRILEQSDTAMIARLTGDAAAAPRLREALRH